MNAIKQRGDTMLEITGFVYVRCNCCKKVLFDVKEVFEQEDGLYHKSAYTCVPCVKKTYTFPIISRSNPPTCSPTHSTLSTITQAPRITVPCQGCLHGKVYVGDVNQYRIGYWCSRICAHGEYY